MHLVSFQQCATLNPAHPRLAVEYDTVGKDGAANDFTDVTLQLNHLEGHVQLDTSRTIDASETGTAAVNVTQQSHNWGSLGWSNSICKEFANRNRTCPDYAEKFKPPYSL